MDHPAGKLHSYWRTPADQLGKHDEGHRRRPVLRGSPGEAGRRRDPSVAARTGLDAPAELGEPPDGVHSVLTESDRRSDIHLRLERHVQRLRHPDGEPV